MFFSKRLTSPSGEVLIAKLATNLTLEDLLEKIAILQVTMKEAREEGILYIQYNGGKVPTNAFDNFIIEFRFLGFVYKTIAYSWKGND